MPANTVVRAGPVSELVARAAGHHCKLLQEKLRALNDAAVAVNLSWRLAGNDAALMPAALAVSEWADARR